MTKPFCLFIQPPFTQLSSPYPAVWYLASYASHHKYSYAVYDDSIACTVSIFSHDGLRTIFKLAKKNLQNKNHPNKATEKQVQHFLEYEDAYCTNIESIIKFLQGRNPSFSSRLCLHQGLPKGWRTAPIVDSCSLTHDDACMIATAMLNDLADFIRYAVDQHFNVTQYGSKIQTSIHDFSEIEAQLESSVLLPIFYKPILEKHYTKLLSQLSNNQTVVVGISVPFPGTLVPALYAGKIFKSLLGSKAVIVLGGGYVSTELRAIGHPGIFSYTDYLAYDAGFGALQSVLDSIEKNTGSEKRICTPDTSRLIFPANNKERDSILPTRLKTKDTNSPYGTLEKQAIKEIHPEYKELNTTTYLSIIDSLNPMHRLWNDTLWLKYRLAYGCYWHLCSFCDTALDYVNNYIAADPNLLFEAITTASKATGITGIHFTDEAMPPALVRHFAEFNAQNQNQYTFWGNVRFDHGWDESLCSFCAEHGLIAVSGGIEIATEAGLTMTQKGFSLQKLVQTLYNFRSAGILVHAYLMYGFPGQTHQSIADSAEIVRALFFHGLITSAFWHRFVLTKHSRLFTEYTNGDCPWLKPHTYKSNFADNDLDFAHSNFANVWDGILERSLSAWSEFGEIQQPLSAFAKKLPAYPSVNGIEYIKKLIPFSQKKT